MDKNIVMERLRKHAEAKDCGWRSRAEWRRNNASWIRRSQSIAVMMLNRMKQKHITQTALASQLGCTQQYVSKLLKGQENITLEMLTKIEAALDIPIFIPMSQPYYMGENEEDGTMVADDATDDWKKNADTR